MNITQGTEETTIELEGRLDTITAPELTKAIEQLTFQKLILKVDKLEYISSAGLRALLVCQRRAEECKAQMVVMHPVRAVIDVIRMSGFNKILTIEEA